MSMLQVEREARTTRTPEARALRSDAADLEHEVIAGLLERLGLSHARRAWPQLAHRADVERWTPRQLLAALLEHEAERRRDRRLVRGSWLALAVGR
jgi:hypothetical protein